MKGCSLWYTTFKNTRFSFRNGLTSVHSRSNSTPKIRTSSVGISSSSLLKVHGRQPNNQPTEYKEQTFHPITTKLDGSGVLYGTRFVMPSAKVKNKPNLFAGTQGNIKTDLRSVQLETSFKSNPAITRATQENSIAVL